MICKTGNIANINKPCIYAILQRDIYDGTNIVDTVCCTLTPGEVETICDVEIKKDRISCNFYSPDKPKSRYRKRKKHERHSKIVK